MKNHIPRYDLKPGELEKVYNSLSDSDKEIIRDQEQRWSTTSLTKLPSKRTALINIADILEDGLDKIDKDKYFKIASLFKASDKNENSTKIDNKYKYETSTLNDKRKYFKEFLTNFYPDWSSRFGTLKELRKIKERIPEKYEQLPKPSKIESLIPKTSDMQLKLYLVLAQLSRRGSELRRTRWSDWNEEEKTLKITSTKNKNTKILPLSDLQQSHLKRWKKEYPFEYPSPKDFIFVSPTDRNIALTRHGNNGRIGKLSKRVLGVRLSEYSLRHIYCTHLQKKLPGKVYEQIADHSLQTANRYSHLDTDDLKEAMSKFVFNAEQLEPNEKEAMKKEIADLKEQIERNSFISLKILEYIQKSTPEELAKFKEYSLEAKDLIDKGLLEGIC